MQVVIAGRYAVGEEIGRGGVGRVHVGHDRRLDRRVAVKLVSRRGIDAAGRERFVREARVAAALAHPNVVAVYDAGETDDELYLVTELVAGPSLADRLAATGPLPIDEAVRVAADVLAALDVAHRAGIVHRYVKPGNVLLTSTGAAKLADFGIAKRLEQETAGLTRTGDVVGTPRYLAPEQVTGGPVTAAADLYATGVVLYELLAGVPPYDAPTPLATALAHRDAPVPDLTAARPGVPRPIATVVARAMAKLPGDRPRSAADMRAELLAALDAERPPEPTAAAPAGLTVPLAATEVIAASPTRWEPRRWWWAVAAALIVVIAVVALAARRDDPGDPDERSGPSTAPAAIAPRTTPAPTPEPTASPTPPTTAPPTSPLPTPPPTTPPIQVVADPATLDGLIAYLTVDPPASGERAEDLLERLRRIADHSGRKQSDDAAETLAAITTWVGEGTLDPGIGELAASILAPIADHPGDGPGNDDDDGD